MFARPAVQRPLCLLPAPVQLSPQNLRYFPQDPSEIAAQKWTNRPHPNHKNFRVLPADLILKILPRYKRLAAKEVLELLKVAAEEKEAEEKEKEKK